MTTTQHFPAADTAGLTLTPDARRFTHAGRDAITCPSRHGRIALPAQTLAATRGHLTVHLLPLEELGQHAMIRRTFAHNPCGQAVPWLSDKPDPAAHDFGRLAIVHSPSWSHPLVVNFAPGNFYPAQFYPRPRFCIDASCPDLRRGRWYRFDLAFDHEAEDHRIYINGHLAGRSDQFPDAERSFEPMGDTLYLRGPQLAFGDITLHDTPLDADAIAAACLGDLGPANADLDPTIAQALTGQGNPHESLEPDAAGWLTACDLSLTEPAQSAAFFLQGMSAKDCCDWTDRGLRIRTSYAPFPFGHHEGDDLQQMYLWTRQVFAGDQYIRLRFRPLEPGGLALLISHATGPQGEDFVADQPPRTDGSMKTIHSSDLRLHHWEFYRQTRDVRNDVPTHAIVKWPWERVLAAGVSSQPLRMDDWNTLELLKRGPSLRGSINGEIVIDGRDAPHAGIGPTLRHGRLAIRCMNHTDLLVADLLVRTRSDGLPTPAASV